MKFLLSLAILFSFDGTSSAVKGKKKMTKRPIELTHFLTLTGTMTQVEGLVFFNGIQVESFTEKVSSIQKPLVFQALPGKNTVRIEITKKNDQSELEIDLQYAPKGQLPDPKYRLANGYLKWSAQEKTSDLSFTVNLGKEQIPVDFPWHHSQISKKDCSEALTLAKKTYTALQKGEPEQVANLFQQWGEHHSWYSPQGQSAAEVTKALLADLKNAVLKEGLTLFPIDLDQLQCQETGQGKILSIYGPNYQSLLQLRDKSMELAWDLGFNLIKVDGKYGIAF